MVFGCTLGSACNFNLSANVNDGSCFFLGDPCDDGDVSTYDDIITDCSAPDYGCQGTPLNTNCSADLDGDGVVTVGDVLSLLSEFGCLIACENDITGDGQITAADMLSMLAEFGSVCN